MINSFPEESLRLLLVIIAFAAIFGIAEAWHKILMPPIEWTRKFAHVGCGLIIASLHQIFTSNWPVIVLGAGAALLLIASRRFGWFGSIYNVKRNSKGDYYYLISAVFLYLISFDHPVYYLIAMLTLTISDGLAAILGSTYQRVTYSVEHHYKSIEGSATFFLCTFLIVHIPLLLLTSIDPLRSILIAIQIALIVTCLEAICLNGIDNLLVPIGTYYLLFKFQNLSSDTILEILAWQCVILAITNIIAWKFHILTISGAITFQLFLFGAFTLGDPIWMIAPLVAVAILLFALGSLKQKSGNVDIKIWQVVAVFYLTLVPALLVLAHNIFFNDIDLHDNLSSKDSFYALFIGAITAQMAITLFRLFFLYARLQQWRWICLAFLITCCLLAIIPLSLWVQMGSIPLSDAAIACAVAIIGPVVYGLIYKRQFHDLQNWKFPLSFPLHFPWELRMQMLSNAAGTLAVLPFYIYLAVS